MPFNQHICPFILSFENETLDEAQRNQGLFIKSLAPDRDTSIPN